LSDTEDVVITTYAERPGYIRDAYDMPDTWPDFMRNDEVAAALLLPVIETFGHPRLTMEDYVALTREDGLPIDGWLRTHVCAGAVIDSIAPTSMVITGTLEEWRTWTGLPYESPREVDVPGALVPVLRIPQHNNAIYVEPNVWMRHRL
jgi:hypothetical protein